MPDRFPIRWQTILIGGLVVLLGSVAILYTTYVHPIELRACAVVERYFAIEQRAFATLDTSELEMVMADSALVDARGSIEYRQHENAHLYFKTTISWCRISPPISSREGGKEYNYLNVAHQRDYYDTAPIPGITKPSLSYQEDLFFILVREDDGWKVSEVISPE